MRCKKYFVVQKLKTVRTCKWFSCIWYAAYHPFRRYDKKCNTLIYHLGWNFYVQFRPTYDRNVWRLPKVKFSKRQNWNNNLWMELQSVMTLNTRYKKGIISHNSRCKHSLIYLSDAMQVKLDWQGGPSSIRLLSQNFFLKPEFSGHVRGHVRVTELR